MERKLLMYIFGNIDVINEYTNKKLIEYQKMYKQNLIGTSGFNKYYDIYNSDPEVRIRFYKSLMENDSINIKRKAFKRLYKYDRILNICRERGPNEQIKTSKDDFVKEKPIFIDYISNGIATDNEQFDSRFCSIYDKYKESLRFLNEYILNGEFEQCMNLIHIVNKYKLLMFIMMKFTAAQINKYSTNNRYRYEINNTLSLIEYIVERNLV